MNGFLPSRPRTPQGNLPWTTVLDPTRAREDLRFRWRIRAAQWRALSLAVEVFGPGVRASLSGLRGTGAFQGLLQLEVPFQDLPRHREAEARFLAGASLDPLLSGVSFIYVFRPLARGTERGGPGGPLPSTFPVRALPGGRP